MNRISSCRGTDDAGVYGGEEQRGSAGRERGVRGPAGDKYTAALPLVSALQTSMVFGQVASGLVGDEVYFTGLALLNPSIADAQVLMELFDRDGRRVTSSSETLPANRRKSKLLTEYFPGLTGQNIRAGYIKVTSDRGLAGYALFGSQTALSAVPAQIVP